MEGSLPLPPRIPGGPAKPRPGKPADDRLKKYITSSFSRVLIGSEGSADISALGKLSLYLELPEPPIAADGLCLTFFFQRFLSCSIYVPKKINLSLKMCVLGCFWLRVSPARVAL